MDVLLETIGLTMAEFQQIVVVAVVLIVGLGILKVFVKLAKSMIRVGCGFILVIVIGMFLLNVLN